MAQCSLLELNETREENELESFLPKIFLYSTWKSEAIAFLESIRLVQVERSKGLVLVYGSTAVIKTTALC